MLFRSQEFLERIKALPDVFMLASLVQFKYIQTISEPNERNFVVGLAGGHKAFGKPEHYDKFMSQQSQGKTLLISGRIVWKSGDLFKGQPQTDFNTKLPKLDSTGKQKVQYGFGLAVAKTDPELQGLMQVMQSEQCKSILMVIFHHHLLSNIKTVMALMIRVFHLTNVMVI